MADEKKTNTKKAAAAKKADAAKASGEKAEAKKAAKKDSKAKKAPAKKTAAKKESKGAKKPAAKKDSKAKKEPAKPAKKQAAKKEPAKPESKKSPAKKAKAPVAPPVVKASARYVRIAPRKARLIADQVRGMHIEKARALLQFSPRGAAQPIHKLIDSAAANAENNHDLVGDEMRVASITVDEGPTLRRFRPRAMGRATPINKRTSHIRVALTPVED
jgi:ribosomal protein L22